MRLRMHRIRDKLNPIQNTLIIISIVLIQCAHPVKPDNPVQEIQSFTDLTGDYLGQTPPGSTPQLFAPGFISIDEHFEHSAAVFSPQKDEVFWVVSPYWYSDQSGPEYLQLYFMKSINGRWTTPQVACFTTDIIMSIDRPLFSPDGNRLYFECSSNLTSEADQDIYVVERTDQGWSDPEGVSHHINTTDTERLLCITGNGSMIFSRNFGRNEDILLSRLVNGEFTEPDTLGDAYNSNLTEFALYLSPHEDYMLIDLEDGLVSTLHISYKLENGDWSDRIRLPYQTGGFPLVSPDGRYLFFLGDGIFWVDTSFIEEYRPVQLK